MYQVSVEVYHDTYCIIDHEQYTALANMIMSVSGTVCHLIVYFPVNQGLAIK